MAYEKLPLKTGEIITEEALAHIQTQADEANAYTDQKISEIPPPPVTSVNSKTGAVVLAAEDVGAETPSGAQAKVNDHANRIDNPHNVTKAQVGLGNVENKSAATIRAESTTPLRVEVVNSFPAHADGKVIFHTVEKKFYGSADGEWV